MPLAIFSMLHIVSYVFEGLIILVALELSYGVFGELFLLVEDIFDDLPILLALIVSYALGQANSTIAHLMFQDAMTCWALGRPSSYYLAPLYDGPSNDFHGVRRVLRSEALRKILISHWNEIQNEDHKENLRSLATREKIDLAHEKFDRRIFAIGLSRATRSAEFNDSAHSILLHFNFSRNMFCALLVSFLVIFIPEVWAWISSSGTLAVNEPDQISILNRYEARSFLTDWEFVSIFVVVMFFLLRRYLYFMGVFTKKVLVDLAENYRPKSDVDLMILKD